MVKQGVVCRSRQVGRCLVSSCVIMAVCLMGAVSQPEEPEGFELADLALLSYEYSSNWGTAWSGPLQAAAVLTWFSEHGYPRLLGDFNQDGAVDVIDSYQLAQSLGTHYMQTTSTTGTDPVSLVVGLSEYVSSVYPNAFAVRIYDEAFANEFSSQSESGAFCPDVIPGITLSTQGAPTIADYVYELRSGVGLLVGVERQGLANPEFLAGRSFGLKANEDQSWPLDFAWAEEDRWAAGFQGQVLRTAGRMEPEFEIGFLSNWASVTSMIVLAPQEPLSLVEDPWECAPDHVAYDIHTTDTEYGSVTIEECVTREGDVDTFTWTLHNNSIDYYASGSQNALGIFRGIYSFMIPNSLGLNTLAMTSPVGWVGNAGPGSWIWSVLSDTGLLPGQTAVFSISVPGPSPDAVVNAALELCPPFQECPPPILCQAWYCPPLPVTTTGPCASTCPDLSVEVIRTECVDRGHCHVDFELTVDVINIGTAATNVPFWVCLELGEETEQKFVPALHPGESRRIRISLDEVYVGPSCDSVEYKVTADCTDQIEECDEENNTAEGRVRCPWES